LIDVLVFIVGFLLGMVFLRGMVGGLVVGITAYAIFTGIITFAFDWSLIPWI